MRRATPASLLVVLLSFGASVRCQMYKSRIEHPIVRYKMTARLDPAAKTVKGHYNLTWWNHTDDSIPDLYFHLYLNAFKNTNSTFMREASISRRHDLLESWRARTDEERWGWVEVDKIQMQGGADLTSSKSFFHPDDDNAQDETVMRVALPQPIGPRESIDLAVDFTSKLPRVLARTGYAPGDYFLIAQWFPKIGVYEGAGERGRTQGGWNCHQFHANTEFYADYGVYDVDLTAPSNFVVGATGFPRGERRDPDGTTTYNFYQEDVHDFAWTASPHFVRARRTFSWQEQVRPEELASLSKILNLPVDQIALRDVDVTLLLQPDHRNLENRYLRAVFSGLKYFGLWYGQYPYDTLTVVDPQRDSNTGGMEYPTFITGGAYFWPGERAFSPEGVTVHEFGHQFWYGLVGNNEFEEAWLDEGFNTYSTGKVLETAYGRSCGYNHFLGIPVLSYRWFDVPAPSFPFAGVGSIPMGPYFTCVEQPERTAGRDYYLEHAKDDELVRDGWKYLDGSSYGVNSYTRTGLTLRTLESYLGPDVMLRVMRTYQQRWRYRHPYTPDFIAVVNEVSGKDMNWFFQQFFYNSDLTDYSIPEIKIESLEGKAGIYGEDGKRKFYSEKDARRDFEKSKDKRYRSTVLVRRLGEAIAPVDVLVEFENGDKVRETWDGKYRWMKYVYERPSKVKSAEVDPDRWLALEANFTNNSHANSTDPRAAARWYVRWIFWLENLFFAAGFFS